MLRKLTKSVSSVVAIIMMVSMLMVQTVSAAPSADEVFDAVWAQADQPVASGQISRSWLWGPWPLANGIQRYRDSSQGDRLVQYYDKSRMEINEPKAPRDEWYVTNGLLVVEMISGKIQIGDTEFIEREAAEVNVVGDLDRQNVVTFADLANVATLQPGQHTSPNLVGQEVWMVLHEGGYQSEGVAPLTVRNAFYVPETGHNIADVFWNMMTSAQSGVLDNPTHGWVYPNGYPITEPYWTVGYINGVAQTVLFQCFERRCLTYNPNNPAEWQVEMGNVGLQHLMWATPPTNSRPAWSTDGTKLAWESRKVNSDVMLWDGTTVSQITSSPFDEHSIVWLNESRFRYYGPGGNNEYNLITGQKSQSDLYGLIMSPDGTKIAYQVIFGDTVAIGVTDVNTGQFYYAAVDLLWVNGEIEWSPDSSMIAYKAGVDTPGGQRLITSVSTFDGARTTVLHVDEIDGWSHMFAWTPDSEELGITANQGQLNFVSVNGVNKRPYTESIVGDFDVASDGTMVYTDESGLLWKVGYKTLTNPEQLTLYGFNADPVWNLQADKIAFSKYNFQKGGYEIRILSLNGEDLLIAPVPTP